MQTSGIYIHIPFCAAKCIYCDFYSVAGQDERIDAFVDSLVMEINSCEVDVTNWQFDAIFIGGGTPNLLEAKQLEKIIGALNNKFKLDYIKEFTLEANPGEAPLEKLRDFHSLGVNRLSIGVQSFNSRLLKFLSRTLSAIDIFNTFDSARKVGFDNINCDMIYNIPLQSVKIWKDDLNKLMKLNPEHISAYSLTVEQNTKLFELVLSNAVQMPKDEKYIIFNSTAREILNAHNYIQYEISNYSKLHRECIHNLHYWKNDFYLGFGPSAHSYDGINRWNNFSSIEKYISILLNGETPIESSEKITEIERTNEIIGFGLRMIDGFLIAEIPRKLTYGFFKQLKQVQSKFPEMLIVEKDRIKLAQKGMNFADAIAVELILS